MLEPGTLSSVYIGVARDETARLLTDHAWKNPEIHSYSIQRENVAMIKSLPYPEFSTKPLSSIRGLMQAI
jgi:hypothetical protein